MENSNIKCQVESCKHNSSRLCSLSSITVGNTTSNANCKSDTECDSFDVK